jgi:hypothetical protein
MLGAPGTDAELMPIIRAGGFIRSRGLRDQCGGSAFALPLTAAAAAQIDLALSLWGAAKREILFDRTV